MSTANATPIEAENFRRNLRTALEAPGCPMQTILAEQAGIHWTTLSRILNGHIVPTMATAAALARTVGQSLSSMLVDPAEFSKKNPRPAIDSK